MVDQHDERVEFVGFWYRLGAALWDLLLIALIAAALIAALLGGHFAERWAAPMTGLLLLGTIAVYLAAGWLLFRRTVGGWLCSQEIVLHASGGRPPPWRMLLRLLATVAFPPGWLWLLFNRRRRSLQDLLAGTCVVADESMRRLGEQELKDHPLALHPVDWQHRS